ncbi:MAG: hypothetical protein Q4E31_08870 [Intestinibacter bartlettii]|uniref:hypothetical protein n=1 Tax=Intestinibacter bartlettii TaxID=261299 RepID=UPI0026EC5CF8|nr:hypothetical protein [Intestinibacter bartlettii]MDO5010923.1 hypothetical protein [Intestinibacter bartlettii]
MFENFEFVFKIVFLCLSIGWIGNILLNNSERQLLINPLLILIASLIIVMPSGAKEILGFEANNVKLFLYIFYYLVIIVGTTLTRGKKGKLKKR